MFPKATEKASKTKKNRKYFYENCVNFLIFFKIQNNKEKQWNIRLFVGSGSDSRDQIFQSVQQV